MCKFKNRTKNRLVNFVGQIALANKGKTNFRLTWPTPLVTPMILFVYEKTSGVFAFTNLMLKL
jgi:hypothetical protein